MNNKVIQIIIAVVLVCTFVVFLQLNGSQHSVQTVNQQKDNEQPLVYTADKIVQTLTKNKIKLKPAKDIAAKTFQIDHVFPKIYTIDSDNRRYLFIYVFPNVEDRKKAEPELQDYSINFLSNSNYIRYGVYKTWNVLIAETLKLKSPTDIRGLKKLNIEDIVFKDLNDGKIKKYTAETTHWKGTYISKYYFHQWQDKNGIILTDESGNGQFLMHYKPKDKSNVGQIEFQFDIGNVSGNTGARLDKNGNFMETLNGKNMMLPSVTLKWNGKVETMTFKENQH